MVTIEASLSSFCFSSSSSVMASTLCSSTSSTLLAVGRSSASSTTTTLPLYSPLPRLRFAGGGKSCRGAAAAASCACKAQKKEFDLEKAVAPVIATAAAAVTMQEGSAYALVDERMTEEGTGLSLGLGNPLLIWIVVGVFGLIWALYTATYSGVQEDEDSGLSL